jgi:glycosyltransferase involved in cell wall biosynthesis
MEPKFSVLIPSYNDEEKIGSVLKSLIYQKKKPDQIVIADDCSKDNTINIVQEFIKINKKIDIKLVINPENLGLYDNLKSNLKFLKYNYFFLGSANDPVYEDFFYDAYIAFSSKKSIKMFFGGFEVCYLNKILYKKKLDQLLVPVVLKPKDYLKNVLDKNEIGVSFSPSIIYDKKTLIENYFIESLHSYHDSFTNNLIGLKYDTYYSPKIYSLWEYNMSSYSQKNNFKKFLIYINVIKLIVFTKNFFLFNIKYILRWIFIFPLKIIYNILFPYYKRLPKINE